MTPELKHALEVIKSECKKNVRLCSRCPLAAWRFRGERQCRITGANIENVRPWPYSPCDWDIDACAQEGENGREEIARPCEFCDEKHAVPYEKNGQMLTPYQETFRTKLFIGDLPWAGKTLFVRSYYCPTYGDSYCNGPRMDSFQINFCPHCGRDLRGDRK